jgi:hypothetical protein
MYSTSARITHLALLLLPALTLLLLLLLLLLLAPATVLRLHVQHICAYDVLSTPQHSTALMH